MSKNEMKRITPHALLNNELISRFEWSSFARQSELLSVIPRRDDWKGNPLVFPMATTDNVPVKQGSNYAEGEVSIIGYKFIGGTSGGKIPIYGKTGLEKRFYAEPEGTLAGEFTAAYLSSPLIISESDFLLTGNVNYRSQLLPKDFSPVLINKIENQKRALEALMAFNIGTGGPFARLVKDSPPDLSGGGTKGPVDFYVDNVNRFFPGMFFLWGSDDTTKNSATKYVFSEASVFSVDYAKGTIQVADKDGNRIADTNTTTKADSNVLFYYWSDYGNNLNQANIKSYQTNNIKNSLLTHDNGGPEKIHGITKTALKASQAYNYSMTGATKADFLDRIFESFNQYRKRYNCNFPMVGLMSRDTAAIFYKLAATDRRFTIEVGRYNNMGQPSVFYIEDSYSPTRLMFKIIDNYGDDTIAMIDPRSWLLQTQGGIRSPHNRLYGRDEGRFTHSRQEEARYAGQWFVHLGVYCQLLCLQPFKNFLIYNVPDKDTGLA